MAVDPGGTTGVAFRLPNNEIYLTTTMTDKDLWAWFEPGQAKPDYVVCEEWQYFDNIARPAGVYTASLVSSLRGICHVLGITFVARTPQSRLPGMAEATSWYKRYRKKRTVNKQDSHEIDALAHLLTFEAQHARYRN